MKLNELISEFLTVKARAKNTIKAYGHDLHLLNRWFGDVDINTIKPRDLSGLLEIIDVKDSSKLRYIRTYSAFWNYCKDVYSVPNITKYLDKPKVKKLVFSSLTSPEVKIFTHVARQESPRNAFMALLALYCGLRVSEIKNLTLAQIDADFVHQVEGKSKNSRSVPFPIELKKDAIRFLNWRQLIDRNPLSPLFPNKDLEPLNEKTIYRIINLIMLDAGIERKRSHPHVLRHTYAMMMLDHIGKTEKNPTKALTSVSRLMGHAYVSTTMKYIKPSNKDLLELVANV